MSNWKVAIVFLIFQGSLTAWINELPSTDDLCMYLDYGRSEGYEEGVLSTLIVSFSKKYKLEPENVRQLFLHLANFYSNNAGLNELLSLVKEMGYSDDDVSEVLRSKLEHRVLNPVPTRPVLLPYLRVWFRDSRKRLVRPGRRPC